MSSAIGTAVSTALVGQSVANAVASKRNLVQFARGLHIICIFDLQKSESHKYSAKATRLPIEGNLRISDNVSREPFGLDLECFISDNPLRAVNNEDSSSNDPTGYDRQLQTETGLTAVSALAGPLGILAAAGAYSLAGATDGNNPTGEPTRSMAAYNTLVKCWKDCALLTVKTKLGTYDNMLIETLSVPRSAKDGDSLTFHISLTTLKIVTSQSVSAQSVHDARTASAKQKLGEQQPSGTFDPNAFANGQVTYGNYKAQVVNEMNSLNVGGE
jgi:hypothetical protein